MQQSVHAAMQALKDRKTEADHPGSNRAPTLLPPEEFGPDADAQYESDVEDVTDSKEENDRTLRLSC